MADLKGMKIPSNIIKNSNILPQVSIPRSVFNLSHGHKTTFNGDYLIPIHWDNMYPGDTYKMNIKALLRLATPIAPVMDNIKVKYFSFFVPKRLLWDNWRRFQGERDNPDDSIDYEVPQLSTGLEGIPFGSLFDYLGVPPKVPNLKFSALSFRAYRLIWNEWFRDQNLQEQIRVPKGDEQETITSTNDLWQLSPKCKMPDYFTTCTVSPQLGDPVILPLGNKATVRTNSDSTRLNYFENGGTVNNASIHATGNTPNSNFVIGTSQTDIADIDTNLYADLSTASSATINELRLAFQIQRIFEKDARSGTRYNEIVLSHFGVTVPDFRLQRPEYIGGGSSDINITPVPNTTGTSDAPQGSLSGVGVGGTDGAGYKYSATEHGIVMTMACVCADQSYQQGLPRKFSLLNRFDYMLPTFWNLGEQAVLNKEIYAQGTAEDEEVFGYQQRYRELRESYGMVSNAMRSTHPQPLDIWHLSEDFANLPKLNSDFIRSKVPFDRIMAVPNEAHIIADFYFQLSATRPLPANSVPGMIDHF